MANCSEDDVREWMLRNPKSSARLMRERRSSLFVQSQTGITSGEMDNPVASFGDLDLKRCLKTIFSTVTNLVSADRCSIFLYDHAQKDLYTFVFDVSAEIVEKMSSDRIHVAIAEDAESKGMKPLSRRAQLMKDYGLTAKDKDIISQSKKLAERALSHYEPKKILGVRIPLGVGITGHVAKTLKGLRIKNAYEDSRFNDEMDRKTGFKTESMMCLPIFGISEDDSEQELLGVSTLINKRGANGQITEFTMQDELMFEQLLVLVGVGLKAAALYQESRNDELEAAKLALKNSEVFRAARTEALKSSSLLRMAQLLYKEENVDSLTKVIVNTAKEIMLADKASVFLIDHDKKLLKSTVFDNESQKEISFPMDKGIAGAVATTGIPINLANAYDDPRFNQNIDILTKYKTVSLLCIPIHSPAGEIIGVANMVNKLEPGDKVEAFNPEDQKLFEDFAVFCGLALHKAIMIRKIEDQKARLKVTMDLMSFYADVRPEEVTAFKKVREKYIVPLPTLKSWQFDAHSYLASDEALAAITQQMFTSLDYDKHYSILDDKLLHYILVVRHNYRPVAYHNYGHAVSVTHAIYIWTLNGLLDPFMSRLEMFAMLVAALNHDIDHRGTNNQFQKMAQTELSRFYNDSTMERHHFNHAMGILNSSKDLNILSNLSQEEYKTCLGTIEKCIMATDLAQFFGTSVYYLTRKRRES